MGEKIGQLRSTSETTQLAILFGAIALWGLLWQIGLVGSVLTLVGLFLTIAGFYAMSLWLGSLLEVFEEGFTIPDQDNPYSIGYDELKSIAVTHTDQTLRGRYVGTRAAFTFGRERGKPWFQYECEYRRGDARQKLLDELTRRCSAAIRTKLRGEMNEQGVVHWTDEVALSPQGLLLQRPGADAPQVVLFHELEKVQIRDNQLQIWNRDDAAVPCCTVTADTRNFIPLYELFCNFRDAAGKRSETATSERPTPVGSLADVAELASVQNDRSN